MIEELLKNNNLKITTQRVRVMKTIKELEEYASLKNIIKTNNDIDQSTIYRIIDNLLLNKIITKDMNCKDDIYYRLIDNDQYYIHCIKCHKNEKISFYSSKIIEEAAIKKGYKIISHKFSLEGICSKCQSKKMLK